MLVAELLVSDLTIAVLVCTHKQMQEVLLWVTVEPRPNLPHQYQHQMIEDMLLSLCTLDKK